MRFSKSLGIVAGLGLMALLICGAADIVIDRLTDLSDVKISSPSNNQVLTYNQTSTKWENKAAGAASQTPWTSDIDAGGYNLSNATNISVNNLAGNLNWSYIQNPPAIPTANDTAYAAGWNGSTEIPTQNALYDKIESIVAGGGEATTVSNTSSIILNLVGTDINGTLNDTYVLGLDGFSNLYNKTEILALDNFTAYYNTTQILALDNFTNYYNKTFLNAWNTTLTDHAGNSTIHITSDNRTAWDGAAANNHTAATVADSPTVDFTITGQQITADVINANITPDWSKIQNIPANTTSNQATNTTSNVAFNNVTAENITANTSLKVGANAVLTAGSTWSGGALGGTGLAPTLNANQSVQYVIVTNDTANAYVEPLLNFKAGDNATLVITNDTVNKRANVTYDVKAGVFMPAALLGDLAVTAPLTGSANNIFPGTDGAKATIAIPKATAAADGYLNMTDWATFNNSIDSATDGNTIDYTVTSGALTSKTLNETKSVTIYNITTAMDIPLWRTPYGITLVNASLWCVNTTSAANVTCVFEERNATMGSPTTKDTWTVENNTVLSDTSFTSATIAAGNWTYLNVTTVNNAPTIFTLTIRYRET